MSSNTSPVTRPATYSLLFLAAEQTAQDIAGLASDIVDHAAVERHIHIAAHRLGQLLLEEIDRRLRRSAGLIGRQPGALGDQLDQIVHRCAPSIQGAARGPAPTAIAFQHARYHVSRQSHTIENSGDTIIAACSPSVEQRFTKVTHRHSQHSNDHHRRDAIYRVPTMKNVGLTQTTDFLPCVGHFFAPEGEKMTYKRSNVPCCRLP